MADLLEELQTRHQQDFVTMSRPIAQLPEPQRGRTMATHSSAARRGVPWYDITGRRRARAAAMLRADADDRAARARHEHDVRNRQEELDAFWRRLTANDPATVLPFLQEAFEDNEDPAAVVGIDEGVAYIVVAAPPENVVPDQVPGVTPTGRPSLRKMPAKTAATYHRQAVAGTVLLTLREAFAVAPGLMAARVAAVQAGQPPVLLWSVQVCRQRLERCLGAARTSLEMLECAADESDVNLVGSARRLGHVEPGPTGWTALFDVLESFADEENYENRGQT